MGVHHWKQDFDLGLQIVPEGGKTDLECDKLLCTLSLDPENPPRAVTYRPISFIIMAC